MTNLGLLVPKLSAMEIGREAGYSFVVREIRHTRQKDARQADGGQLFSRTNAGERECTWRPDG